MAIHGPDPLETDAASNAVGETLVHLQRRVRDDLKAAQTDGILERPVLGLLVCLRSLLEAIPSHRFHCHTDDVRLWRGQYFAWLDANGGRMRLKAKDKKTLREHAAREFDRVLELSDDSAYPLDSEDE